MADVKLWRDQIVDRVSASAEWRFEKARQYPDDRRNIRSSQALRTLAENLQALPLDDPKLAAYAEMMERSDVLVDTQPELLFETENQAIGRYGFDYPEDGEPSAFLDGLTRQFADLLEEADEELAEQKAEADHERALAAADEGTKRAAQEVANKKAEAAAKEAAEAAYKRAYDSAYEEAYGEAYRTALADAIKVRR